MCAQAVAVEASGYGCGQRFAYGDEQAKGLAGAQAVQMHVGERGFFCGLVRYCLGGLFGGFLLAVHASASQPVHAAFELAAMDVAVNGMGGRWRNWGYAHVVTQAAQPIMRQKALERGFAGMQAKDVTDIARRHAVLRKADTQAVQTQLHQGAVQLVIECTHQRRNAGFRVGHDGDIDIVAGHGSQFASPNTPPRINVATTKCCCSRLGTLSRRIQLSSRL